MERWVPPSAELRGPDGDGAELSVEPTDLIECIRYSIGSDPWLHLIGGIDAYSCSLPKVDDL